MNTPTHLSSTTVHSSNESPIFSPSKALRDREIARDWAYVSTWLTSKYHPHSVPRFERNEETLSALLALVAANTAADERAELLLNAQEEELEALDEAEKKNSKSVKNEILESIEGSLDPEAEEALHSIAELALDLGSTSTDPLVMAQDITNLTTRNFEAEDQTRRTELLCQELEIEIRRLQSELDELKEEQRLAQENQEVVQQQIADWSRASKLLGIKFEEYREKVAAIDRDLGNPKLTIDDLVAKEKEVLQKRKQVKALGRELQGYNGLPTDLASAREEYQRLNETVSKLRMKRDELFENMALG